MFPILQSTYENLSQSRTLTLIGLIAFILLTYFTTLNGVAEWMAIDMMSGQFFILAFFVFFIQALPLLQAPHKVFFFRNFLLSPIPYLLACLVFVIALLFSVFFSFSFYYSLFSADKVVLTQVENKKKELENQLATYRDNFSKLAEAFDDLAKHSQAMLSKEEKMGGSCEGDFSLPKKGVRYRYRLNEMQLFSGYAEQSKNIKNILNDIGLDEIEIDNKKYQNDKSQEINRLNDILEVKIKKIKGFIVDSKDDPDIKNEFIIFNDRKTELEGHKGVNRLTEDQNIKCLDHEIDEKIDKIINDLKAANNSKVQVEQLFDPTDRNQLEFRVIGVIHSVVFGNIGNEISDNDYIALFCGVFVECLIIIFTIKYLQANNYIRKTWSGGYKGDYYSTAQLEKICKDLKIDKGSIQNLVVQGNIAATKVLVLMTEQNKILNLMRQASLCKELTNIVVNKALPQFVEKKHSFNDEDKVSVFIFEKYVWDDIVLSLEYMKSED